ncbi:hypothetical protein JQK62_25010, partial [Leptospira santarosai]|nr:hypothetical protein [Leptospira santarosai]
QRYYLVREDVLTEAMQKTLDAKHLLQSGEVASIWDAVKKVDLSRSAFTNIGMPSFLSTPLFVNVF